MNSLKYPNSPKIVKQAIDQTLGSMRGNVLVYLVVVILIFGVLGVTIVSLFTTATSSSATPNDARRAYYTAEAGVRFATGIIKDTSFQQSFISEINTTPQYTLANGNSFTVDVFSPWFISTSGQRVGDNNPFTLSIPYSGKIPVDPEYPADSNQFPIPFGSNFWLVDWKNFRGNGSIYPPDSYAEITSALGNLGSNSLTITLEGTHGLDVDAGDTVCIAVQPTDANASLADGESIYITRTEEAKRFFPSRHGAIRIVTLTQTGDYYYDTLVDASTKLELTNLKSMPGTNFNNISISTNDWVVLSSSNYRIITTGTSGDVTTTIGMDRQEWLFPNSGQWTIFEREFIDDAVANVEGEGIIETTLGATEDEDEIQFGETGGTDEGFGGIWYGGDKAIGGDSDRCRDGRCLFGFGIRAFFTLKYTGDGEGFVFTLINGADNTSGSAGGDVERSELLGYAGDSRTVAAGAPFLDGTPEGRGLLPPKMGIEFDAKTNFDHNFEQTLIYCDGASLNANTRNDPRPGGNDEDAVQYVFWGSEDMGVDLNPSINCREDPDTNEDDSTYDDNKHDADDIFETWRFDTGGDVHSSPAVGADGSVYVGSASQLFFGLNPADRLADMSENTLTSNEWSIDTGGNIESDAAIGGDGQVYVGAGGGRIYAFNPVSRLAGDAFPNIAENEWLFFNASGKNINTSPAVDDDGTVYIGDDDGVFYAFPPDSNIPKWTFTHADFIKASRGRPALANYNGRKRVYITGRDGSDRTLFALDPEDREDNVADSKPFPTTNEWVFDMGDQSEYMPGVDPNSGRIYTDTTGNLVVGLFPAGAKVWSDNVYRIGDDIDSTPVVDDGGTPADSSDDTIYALANNGILHAVNTDGSPKWTFFSGSNSDRSIPAIGPDGTVYFGSKDGKLYAVGHDGESMMGTAKYSWDTGGEVNSSPAIDPRDETVYVGSDSDYLHAINQLAEPRSFRDESVEDLKMVSSADFTEISFADTNDSNDWLKHGDGQWAVRIEVTYEGPDGPIDGTELYDYRLKTWIEKCTAAGCSNFLSSKFRDTLGSYKVSARPPKLDQTIKLTADEHARFERFLFGFTSAAATGDTQAAVIRFFELSFVRVTDPDVTSDPNLDS